MSAPTELAGKAATAEPAREGGGSRRRDLVAAISLANLSFFRFWNNILYAPPMLAPIWSWRDLLAITVNVGALAAFFWIILRLGKRARRFPGWHRGLYLLPVLLLGRVMELRYLRGLVRLWTAAESDVLLALLVLGTLLTLANALVRWWRRVLAGAEILTLCLFAFVPVTFLQTAWVLYRDMGVAKRELIPSAPLSPAPAGHPRVVWIVFDEMDWRYVFPQRPPSLQMPEMDRLRGQAIYADTAFESAIETSEAMMSYLAGRQVYFAELTGRNSLRLHFLEEPREVDWPGPPNLLSRARQAGFNTAVVGWFLPYCRLFPQSLNRCYWEPLDTRVRDSQPSLATSLRSQLRNLSPLETRQRHRKRYLAMLEQSKKFVADPELGLVVLHLPVPHEPPIYRRDDGELTLFNFHSDWYFDNLALADRTLGELRRAMEQAGLWDQTTVVVTSDHALRWYAMLDETVDPRVPFLVKLAGQHQALAYHHPLRVLVVHDLTLALLRGEFSQPAEVAHWLEQRSSNRPGPKAAPSP